MNSILIAFIVFQILKLLIEMKLAYLNKRYYSDERRQQHAIKTLGINSEDFEKTLAYSRDKYAFSMVTGVISLVLTLSFLAIGGFGWAESWAIQLATDLGGGSIVVGLFFMGILMLLSTLVGIPAELYHTFTLEEKHGFNRQTLKGYLGDKLKGLSIGVILGGLILWALLAIMESMGANWWVWAWIAMSAFSLFTMWLYPTLLAPMFNKFEPVEDGELLDKLNALAQKVEFASGGVFVMDASKRSSHGNAYFTGIFGERRIVLFDTLIKSLSIDEIVAVLAHELGHFKLNHIRWAMIRSIAMMGVVFYAIGAFLPMKDFYTAFYLQDVTNYGALVIFSMWFGLLDFFLQPLFSWMSRQNEFAADSFAKEVLGTSTLLSDALLKLRENSRSMPITHPLFSLVYLSHPPLDERLKALNS